MKAGRTLWKSDQSRNQADLVWRHRKNVSGMKRLINYSQQWTVDAYFYWWFPSNPRRIRAHPLCGLDHHDPSCGNITMIKYWHDEVNVTGPEHEQEPQYTLPPPDRSAILPTDIDSAVTDIPRPSARSADKSVLPFSLHSKVLQTCRASGPFCPLGI